MNKCQIKFLDLVLKYPNNTSEYYCNKLKLNVTAADTFYSTISDYIGYLENEHEIRDYLVINEGSLKDKLNEQATWELSDVGKDFFEKRLNKKVDIVSIMIDILCKIFRL